MTTSTTKLTYQPKTANTARLAYDASGKVAGIAGPEATYSVGGIVPDGTNSAAIAAAMAKVAANGGGIVRLLPIEYTIDQDISLVSGVHLVGVPHTPVVSGNVPDFWSLGANGTRFKLSAGVTALKWNNVDKGASEAPNIMNFALKQVRIYGIAFSDGLRAIKIGAYLAMGALFSEIDEVYCYNQTGDYAIDIQNSQFFKHGKIRVLTNLTTGGGYRIANSLDSNLLTGDSHVEEIYARCKYPLNRGVTFECIGPAGALLNDVKVTGRIHSSRYGFQSTPTTINITTTSGVADLSVPDAAQYALCQVGMPIKFNGSAPTNFDVNVVFFVISRNDAGNTIQLAEADYTTTGVLPGSSGAYTAYVSGWPTFVARANAGNAVKNCNFGDLACELTGNVASLMFSHVRNCTAHVNNPSTSYTGTGWIVRDAEMSLTYAGSANVTSDASGLYGFCKMRNLAGGPYQLSSTSNFTLDSSWNNRDVRYMGATDITITIPINLPVGFEMTIIPNSTGNVIFAAASGAAIFSLSSFKKTGGQYSSVTLKAVSRVGYSLVGNLQA